MPFYLCLIEFPLFLLSPFIYFFSFFTRIYAVFACHNLPVLPRLVSAWITSSALQCKFISKRLPLPDASSRCGSCVQKLYHISPRKTALLMSLAARLKIGEATTACSSLCHSGFLRAPIPDRLHLSPVRELNPPRFSSALHHATAVSPDGARCGNVSITAA